MKLEVHGSRIVITLPGSDYRAVYFKPEDRPQLIANGLPTGTHEFKAKAWELANLKARELGWIV